MSDVGQAMKIAIPLAATAAAIYFTGGAAAPAATVGGGAGGAAGLGAAGATEAAGAGGFGALGTVAPDLEFAAGMETSSPVWLSPAGPGSSVAPIAGSGAASPWEARLHNASMAAMGGQVLNSTMGLNQPRTPFQMRDAQAPSPVGGGGGRFQPTSESSMAMLANKMAQRQQQQREIRFARG